MPETNIETIKILCKHSCCPKLHLDRDKKVATIEDDFGGKVQLSFDEIVEIGVVAYKKCFSS